MITNHPPPEPLGFLPRAGNSNGSGGTWEERRAAARLAQRQSLKCQVCLKPLMVSRSHARYCSNTCRQTAHREGMITVAEWDRTTARLRLDQLGDEEAAYLTEQIAGLTRVYRKPPDDKMRLHLETGVRSGYAQLRKQLEAAVKKYADVLDQGPLSTPWQASLDG